MNKQIYVSNYGTGPEVDRLTSLHFELDLKYAYELGFEYIAATATDTLFKIVNESTIEECSLDDIQEVSDNDDCTDEDYNYCVQCHNLDLIDQVINNTLSQTANITPQQADTMLKLGNLKLILLEGGH